MRVLVACEFSGVVRDAFIAKGHDAYSCDILPPDTENEYHEKHIEDDVLLWLDDGWDLMIAHPPCTYLCSSGLHWNKKDPTRQAKTEKALDFVQALLDAPIERIALENPVGCISTQIRMASQYIQPWEFGHDASKKTGLWLKNLPRLKPTEYIKPRYVPHPVEVEEKPLKRWGNQTDSGQNKLGPSDDRWKLRAITYQGIADAMADQWGGL